MEKEATEINNVLKEASPTFYSVLSNLGKRLYMPKGIIFQSNQSKKHAKSYNASIGIAKENIGFSEGKGISVENLAPMTLNSIGKYFVGLEQNEIFNYAPQPGLPVLRDYWHEKIVNQNPCLKSKEQISRPVLTGGLTHAISLAAELFTDPGDDLYLADKFWENYSLIFNVKYQVNFVHYKLYKDDYSGFNLESLEETLSKSKKDKLVLLFNFPNNPTGYTATEEEMDGIRDILVRIAEKGKKIVVLCDDAYYGLFYDKNIYPGSIFSKLAGIHDNIVAVKIDGISKECYAWGFRVGFITFADNFQSADGYGVMEEKAISGIRSSVSSCSSIAQAVLSHAIKDEDYSKEREEKYRILESRVAKVKQIVYREEYKSYWDVYPFNSGYFMCLRIKDIPADTVRKHALFRYGLGTIAFDQDLRVAFSCISEENLETVFQIIANSIEDIKKGDIETGNE
ncbi:MAG: aminotransferase class I/II-fold pyridoxal phosphate-dependent enzyme [Spirochaetales bacterium]|nr:aminotransferase class I/II-fold pyridoxal phosphate-dependent enzyme [Spirochaetales bacterium]